MIKNTLTALALFAAAMALPSIGQGKVDATSVSTPIPELIKQLNNDAFAVREAAARKLQIAGADAVPNLVKAAIGEGAEVKRRALIILQKTCSEADEKTIAALEKIAGSGSPEEVEIAESLLRLTRSSKTGEIPVDELVIPGATVEFAGDTMRIRLAGGGLIQTKIGGGKGTGRSMIRNGSNTFIAGASDGIKGFIYSGSGGEIKMKVTADEDGEPVTRAYQFNNVAQLRELNPDLFEFFSTLEKGDPRAPRIPRP